MQNMYLYPQARICKTSSVIILKMLLSFLHLSRNSQLHIWIFKTVNTFILFLDKGSTMWNAILMQQGNFIDVFLAWHVSGTYAHHQEHEMLSCSIWFCAPSFWMGGGLESHCVGRVCGADGAVWHSVQKTTCCNLTSNAPDDGHM